MQRIVLLLVCLIVFEWGYCQNTLKDYDFLVEVKQIDELIERLNDTSTTFRKYLFEESGNKSPISHQALVKLLFNRQNSQIPSDLINDFTDFICDSSIAHPLSLEDTNWYAEAKAKFTYENRKISCILYMHVNTYKNYGAYWMIAGIKSPAIASDVSFENTDCEQHSDTTQYIPLTYSSTYFVGLRRLLTSKICPYYYFEPRLLASQSGQDFVNALLQGKLRFEYIDTITYHYTYLQKWKFTVDLFERKGFNSGWLISDLSLVSEKDKSKNFLDFLAFDTSATISTKDWKQIDAESKELIRYYGLIFNNAVKSHLQGNSVDTLNGSYSSIFTSDCIIEDNIRTRGKKKAPGVSEYFRKVADLFYPSDINPISIDNIKLISMKPRGQKIMAYVQFTENYVGKMRTNDIIAKRNKNKNIAEIVCVRTANGLTCHISRILLQNTR